MTDLCIDGNIKPYSRPHIKNKNNQWKHDVSLLSITPVSTENKNYNVDLHVFTVAITRAYQYKQ